MKYKFYLRDTKSPRNLEQTDDCVILVQGHKMPTSVFSFIKFSNCCRNTNLDYTFQTKSYYFTIICSKLRKGPNTVQAGVIWGPRKHMCIIYACFAPLISTNDRGRKLCMKCVSLRIFQILSKCYIEATTKIPSNKLTVPLFKVLKNQKSQ